MVFEDRTGAILPGLAEAWAWSIKEAQALSREGWLDTEKQRLWIEVCDSHHCAIMSFPIDQETMQ